MSCFDVKILEADINTIEIETCIGDQPSTIEIVTYDNISTIEINSCVALLPSEINELITVKDILAGSGISISDTSGVYTVSLSNPTIYSSGIIDFLESVQDVIGNSGLLAGNYININYDDTSGLTTISTSGLQPSGNYSVVGHTHTSNDITNFSSSVSGLLPSVTGTGYVNSSFSNNIYTLSASGLQPSGNYSVVGHNHVIADVSGLQNALDSKQPSGVYASGIHFHVSNDITDFHSSVSGLLPNVTGVGQATSSFNNNLYTISVTGLQPSGNYTIVGHSHLASDITNFDSSVSGLLPTVSGIGYAVTSFDNNVYTISVTGVQPSGNYSVVGHTHTSNQITDFDTSVSGLIPPSNFTSLTGISGVIVTNSGTNYYVGLNDPTIQLADITDLSSNARNFLSVPSSDNLSILVTNETGSGVLVFNDSPSFSGIPTVPTAPSGTNSTQIASTAFVRSEISNLVDSAPVTLDTLNELAAALGDDPNFATTVTNTLAGKANLSGAIFTGSVTIPSGTGNFDSLTVNGTTVSVSGHSHTSSNITNFNSSVSGLLPSLTGTGYAATSFNNNIYTISVTGLQPSGNYSTVGHTHISSNITDFNSSVSGLLPSVTGSGYVNSLFANNIYTISVSGLQPSGNYSVVGHSHVIADVSGLQNSLDSKQPSGVYASGIHYHTSSDITNFNSSVSGLLPNVTGVGQASSTFINNIYTISVTGLQPSGNYSVVGHTHVTNDITNFASGVSGIIDSSLNTSLVAGTGINLIFDSNLNTLTIATTGLQPSGNYSVVGHTHTSSNITDFNTSVSGLLPVKNIISGSGIGVSSISGNYTVSVTGTFGLTSEEVDDRVSNLLVAGTGISLDYDNNSNILTISTSGAGYEEIIEYLNTSNFPASGNIDLLYVATDVSRLYKWTGYEYVELGPSQAYLQNHTHTVSQITDFNSGVSGLLPVKNILAGSGIEISSSSGDFTVSVTGSFGLTSEEVDDRVNNLLIAGTGISLVYDNNLNTLTVSTTGLQPSGNYSFVGHSHIIDDVSGLQSALDNKQPSGVYASGIHTHTASEITDFNEAVDDRIGSGLFVAGTGINLTYNDSGNSFTISVSGLINNATNNRILTSRDNTTTGIDAESNLTFDGNLLSVSGNLIAISGTYNQLVFNTSLADPDLSQGQLQWNNSEGTLDLGFTDTYSQHVGEELHYRVRNNTASTLTKGTVVYASGLTPGGNNRIEVAPFTADGSVREVRFMGLVTENISVGVNGYTTQFGYIRGIDTRGDAASNGYAGKLWDAGEPSWSEGDILYAHPTAAGKLTNVEPKHSISVAIVLNRHQNQGKIFVRPVSYGHLDDNHDVNVSGATNGQFLQYNSATDYWVPSSSGNFTTLSINGTGVSVSGHIHTVSAISDFNSGVSGLLPGITGSTHINAGFSNNIYTISVTGLQPLLTNPVTGVGTSGYLSIFNNTNSISNSIIYESGTAIGINTTSPAYSLDVNGSIRAYRADSNSLIYYERTGVGNGNISMAASTTTFNSSLPYRFFIGANERLSIRDSGVGIGTTSPTAKLNVIGSGLFASTTGLTPNALLDLYSTASGEMVFNVEGTNGSLFSVVDNLNGSLMSVNNNAGLPVFEVFSDDKIVGGRFNQNDFVITSSGNVGIGTASPSGKLDVVGNVNVSGSFTILSDVFTLSNNKTVSASGDVGSKGNICWDSNYVYICVSDNNWKRISYDSW